MNFTKIVKQCRIDKPRHFKLADHDPAEKLGLSTDIDDVKPVLEQGIERLEVAATAVAEDAGRF